MHLVSLTAHLARSPVLLTAALAAAAVAATGCTEEEGFPVERLTTLSRLPEVGAEVTIEQGADGMKLEVIVRYAGRAHSPDRALGSKASPYCPVLGESFAFHLGDAGIGVTSSGELEVNGLDEHFVCHHPSVIMIVPPFLQRAGTQLILRDDSKTITVPHHRALPDRSPRHRALTARALAPARGLAGLPRSRLGSLRREQALRGGAGVAQHRLAV